MEACVRLVPRVGGHLGVQGPHLCFQAGGLQFTLSPHLSCPGSSPACSLRSPSVSGGFDSLRLAPSMVTIQDSISGFLGEGG